MSKAYGRLEVILKKINFYEGLNLSVLDMVIRQKLPIMKETIEQILEK